MPNWLRPMPGRGATSPTRQRRSAMCDGTSRTATSRPVTSGPPAREGSSTASHAGSLTMEKRGCSAKVDRA
ncbi:hypothetical protein ACLEPN_00510 [Myxococcus sp. 1LA]